MKETKGGSFYISPLSQNVARIFNSEVLCTTCCVIVGDSKLMPTQERPL